MFRFISLAGLAIGLLVLGSPHWLPDHTVSAQNAETLADNRPSGDQRQRTGLSNNDIVVGSFGGTVYQKSQAFTTGGNEDGYTIDEVTVELISQDGNSYAPVVAIHADSSDNPATSAHITLTAPATAPSESGGIYGVWEFTTNSNTRLTPNTTYHLVFTATSGIYYVAQDSANETATDTFSSGWSFADETRSKAGTASWAQAQNNKEFRATIEGVAAIDPDVIVSPTSLTVTEGDDTTGATYTIVLETAPISTVFILPEVSDDHIEVEFPVVGGNTKMTFGPIHGTFLKR